jgi:hypothetical protein
MQIRKTLIAALALAIAFAFSPIDGLQAASFGPGSQPGSDNLTYTVKAKGKAKAKKGKRAKRGKRGKRAASKRAGRCGTHMYWSRSKRSCQDARSGPAKK